MSNYRILLKAVLQGATVLLCVVHFSGTLVLAEDKEIPNRITAYLEQGASDSSAVVTLWMANVNPVIGFTLPFKFAPGDSVMHLDSMKFSVGIADPFIGLPPRYNVTNQTLLINQRRKPDSSKAGVGAIPPGEGLLARMYFSAETIFPMKDFAMVAVQLPPEAKLIYVTSTLNTVLPEFVLLKESPPPWPPSSKTAKSSDKQRAGEKTSP